MTKEEIIEVMNKPLNLKYIPQYRIIYQLATGKPWNACFCGNGWNRFTTVCKNYANILKSQTNGV